MKTKPLTYAQRNVCLHLKNAASVSQAWNCKFYKADCGLRWNNCKARLDLKTLNNLIMENIGLVFEEAKKYSNQTFYPREDLINDGVFGLRQGIIKYDYRRGFKLSTFVTWWIRQAMGRGFKDQSQIIRKPVWAHDVAYSVAKIQDHLGGREPTDEELCHYLGNRHKEVMANQQVVSSLDLEAEQKTKVRHESIASTCDTHREVVELIDQQNMAAVLSRVLKPKEAQVIRLRFGFTPEGRQTLETIGKQFGVTRERIRQIEKMALEKLKRAYLRAGITDYKGTQ